MKFFDEKFEYITLQKYNPSNKDFDSNDYDSEEYKNLEWYKEYYTLVLNEAGAKGWELIDISDDSHKGRTIDRLTFKRSSRSEYFGTGLGIDVVGLSDLAKEISEDLHISF